MAAQPPRRVPWLAVSPGNASLRWVHLMGIPTLAHSKPVAVPLGIMDSPSQVGTRANGTDSLVYRVLRSPEYRTEEVLVRFLGAAIIPAPPLETIRKRARK